MLNENNLTLTMLFISLKDIFICIWRECSLNGSLYELPLCFPQFLKGTVDPVLSPSKQTTQKMIYCYTNHLESYACYFKSLIIQ